MKNYNSSSLCSPVAKAKALVSFLMAPVFFSPHIYPIRNTIIFTFQEYWNQTFLTINSATKLGPSHHHRLPGLF